MQRDPCNRKVVSFPPFGWELMGLINQEIFQRANTDTQ